MTHENIKIFSFNVNGTLNPITRSKILTKMNKEKAHIVYLQETHLDNKEHEKLRKMGFTKIFFSLYKSNHKRGVAILISNKISFKQTHEQKEKEGRFILVRGAVDGNEITLLNICAPSGSDFSFFQKIFDIIISETVGILICGGDLNIHLQPKLDVSNHTHTSKAVTKKFFL